MRNRRKKINFIEKEVSYLREKLNASIDGIYFLIYEYRGLSDKDLSDDELLKQQVLILSKLSVLNHEYRTIRHEYTIKCKELKRNVRDNERINKSTIRGKI